MYKILVIGLESSCTKYVARLIAFNLKIVPFSWDGNDTVFDDRFLVRHRSIPWGHESRQSPIDVKTVHRDYDKIVIVTRDFNCSLLSKIKDHQPEVSIAREEHAQGVVILRRLSRHLSKNMCGYKLHYFSYETAYIMRTVYVRRFLRELGISSPIYQRCKEINAKHIKEA
jgi:hypothetical protein